MASKINNQIKDDFAEVFDYLLKKQIVPTDYPPILETHAKTLHSNTFCLILLRHRLEGLPEHGQAFIDELASDALQIMPQILMGYRKTAKLLMRGLIENTLRHLYFSDHPVEFIRMNRDTKWYLSIDSLFDYARNHHDFIITERKFDALAQLSSMYSQLSAGVHGRAIRDLEMRTALEKIQYEPSLAAKDVESVTKCVQPISFLLSLFHREQVRTFSTIDRRVVMKAMPPEARRVLTEHVL